MELDDGRYRLLRRLGQGGTGVVYAAADSLLGRTVAIKALHSSFGRTLLHREGRSLAGLNHPGVVALYDLIEPNGRPYLVMEYVDGCDLEHWLAAHGPLPLETALSLFARIAAIVSATHEAGIIHCDLKPSNVLLSTGGEIKLTDFTLARVLRRGAPATSLGGSEGYAAPEALRGEVVTAQTDVYSLGALLRRLTAGTPEAATVEAAIERALAPLPGDRFPTVDALLAALPLPAGDITRVSGRSLLSDITRILPRTPRAPRARPRRLAAPIAALCAALTLAGGAVFMRLPAAASPARVTLPNLVATQSGSAQLVTRSLQLRYRVSYAYSSTVPVGVVLAQRPAPNTQIDKHGVVTLTVSKGPAPVAVPDLNGNTADAATAQLSRLGFRVTLQSRDSLDSPAGIVLDQTPAPDTLRVPGATITLTISQKPWWDVFGW